ncbi:MAG: putative acyl-CoA dehydrogenase [Frankiales bacterium]|nr:putative acyl-CoA dehydrogenase [Frankiales bacterium]
MSWDFTTEPEFQAKLDWAMTFVREEVEPLDLVWPHDNYKPLDDEHRRIVDPLKQQVRDAGLWACHLGPELGGPGYGQLKLAMLNEILGRSAWAPIIFGTQAPDTGNAEILAHFGTEEQKKTYLEPLMRGDIFSCFSMTEPQGGGDPGVFETEAVKDGDSWVINGWKFYSSNAKWAEFLIVMAWTNKEAGLHNGMSMLLVPTNTPGVEIVRNAGAPGESEENLSHALIHYQDVRVPLDAVLGGEGGAFHVAQTRLGGGRVHHAMRTVGQCQRALDMMCERALSRTTKGSKLADKQDVQTMIAETYAELTQFRLMVMFTAWKIDHVQDYKQVKKEIAAIKVLTAQVLKSILYRAILVHGALGTSGETPLAKWWSQDLLAMGAADGPSIVHQVTVAKEVLKDYQPAPGLWPTEHIPTKLEAARKKLGVPAPVSH